jgi:adenine/guanine phosphoribosyltransferase-like PRPP-binding protein
VGVQGVRLAGHVAQELEVQLVVPRASRPDLHRQFIYNTQMERKQEDFTLSIIQHSLLKTDFF